MRAFATWTTFAVLALLGVASLADACCRRGCRGHSGCYTVIYSSSGCGTISTSGGRVSNYPPDSGAEPLPIPGKKRTSSETSGGVLQFVAPEDAQIWVDGELVQRSGETWRYTAPSGRQRFEVKARWTKDGKVINQSRTIDLDASGRTTVDFTRPAAPTPRPERLEGPNPDNRKKQDQPDNN